MIDLDAGCCGMAGSFGYEVEHYEISRQVGEQRLLPAVRQAGPDAVVVAPGFSCRLADHAFHRSRSRSSGRIAALVCLPQIQSRILSWLFWRSV